MIRQRGFNLIDLLVGLAISMFGLLAVSRVMITFNQQRNTSVQSIEAQSNGTMALYLLERDLQEAGYGMMQLQNCSNIQWYFNGNQIMLPTVPVRISDSVGAGGSDSIRVQFARSGFGVPATPIQQQQASYSARYAVGTTVGFSAGDLIVANASNVCTMSQVHSATAGVEAVDHANHTIAHDRNATASLSPYNPDPLSLPTDTPEDSGWFADANRTVPATNANLAAPPNSTLVNLGQFISQTYSVPVGDNRLTMKGEVPNGAASPLVDGIVFMKAQYGVDTDGNRTVDSWRDGTYAVNNTNANLVLAVRVGVVARSPLLEKTSVEQPDTVTVLPAISEGGVEIGAAVTYPLDNTQPALDKRYRYKAYYTVLPLKNVIWSR